MSSYEAQIWYAEWVWYMNGTTSAGVLLKRKYENTFRPPPLARSGRPGRFDLIWRLSSFLPVRYFSVVHVILSVNKHQEYSRFVPPQSEHGLTTLPRFLSPSLIGETFL